jgi:hypothetical protein
MYDRVFAGRQEMFPEDEVFIESSSSSCVLWLLSSPAEQLTQFHVF